MVRCPCAKFKRLSVKSSKIIQEFCYKDGYLIGTHIFIMVLSKLFSLKACDATAIKLWFKFYTLISPSPQASLYEPFRRHQSHITRLIDKT